MKKYSAPDFVKIVIDPKEAYTAYCYSVSSGFEVTGSCTATSIIEPNGDWQCWRNDMGPEG